MTAWGFGAGLAFVLFSRMRLFMVMQCFDTPKGHECYQ
ncbi:hypothetical protein M075_3595 [Bacteroides fragilis str. 20793-3]|nr:hypothetical protein M075_3595 [Bacteroides fragilis str. 20793-3]